MRMIDRVRVGVVKIYSSEYSYMIETVRQSPAHEEIKIRDTFGVGRPAVS